jgi:hypothetical protein
VDIRFCDLNTRKLSVESIFLRKMLSGWRARYTGGIKQFGRRAGRGGDVTRTLHAKISTDEGELSQSSPFSLGLVHLHSAAKADYLTLSLA